MAKSLAILISLTIAVGLLRVILFDAVGQRVVFMVLNLIVALALLAYTSLKTAEPSQENRQSMMRFTSACYIGFCLAIIVIDLI